MEHTLGLRHLLQPEAGEHAGEGLQVLWDTACVPNKRRHPFPEQPPCQSLHRILEGTSAPKTALLMRNADACFGRSCM